jgi:pimeloyl-ACP methyl ester carboxylesterase
MEWRVKAEDGRILVVEDIGDRSGPPVLVHVGSPNSRHLYGRTVADAAARGLRLISYDRPGYGKSTPRPGRTMADCAADVRAICAALDIERLVTWGPSGGGPHVLACAALLPDLVVAAASLCSPAPYDAEGLDWLAGMGPGAEDDVRLMFGDRDAARAAFAAEREQLLAVSPAELAQQWKETSPDADLALLTDEAISVQQALADGVEGFYEDNWAQLLPWGFDPAYISVPVLLLHGRRDQSVPVSHGQWLADHITGVEARFYPDEGHELRENHIGHVHAWLTQWLET